MPTPPGIRGGREHRLDLYDRRFAIYEKTLAFKLLLDNSDEKSIKTAEFVEVRRAFIKSMREAQFLFKPESGVLKRMIDLQRASFDIINSRETRGQHNDMPSLVILLKQKAMAAFNLFEESIPFLENAMAPYLNFQDALLVEDKQVEATKARFWKWSCLMSLLLPDPTSRLRVRVVDGRRHAAVGPVSVAAATRAQRPVAALVVAVVASSTRPRSASRSS